MQLGTSVILVQEEQQCDQAGTKTPRDVTGTQRGSLPAHMQGEERAT